MAELLCALLFALAQASERGFQQVRVRLSGPLEGLHWLETSGAEHRLQCSLRSGAELVVDLPIRSGNNLLARELELRPLGGGSAELIGLEDTDDESLWTGIPAALRRRTRPPAPASARTPSQVELALLGATLLLVLALRRRPGASLLAGAAGGALLLCLPATRERRSGSAVLDGAAGNAWLLFAESAAAKLELPAGGPLRLEVLGPREKLSFRVHQVGPGEFRWWAEAEGLGLTRLERLEGAGRELSLAANRLGALSDSYFRAPDGSWTRHGPWAVGDPLPAALEHSEPPGWLASALPQGVPVWIGRAAESWLAELAPSLHFSPADGGLWVRWTGN